MFTVYNYYKLYIYYIYICSVILSLYIRFLSLYICVFCNYIYKIYSAIYVLFSLIVAVNIVVYYIPIVILFPYIDIFYSYMFSVVNICMYGGMVLYTSTYTVYVIRLCIYSGLLKPKLLTINILHAFTSSFTLAKWCATSIYMRPIRTYCTRTAAIFATIFCKRYNYITEAGKMSCRACKCPFWANVEILENGDGGRTGGVPGFSTYTQAAKNLEFF